MVLPVTTPLWGRLISRNSKRPGADFTSGTLQAAFSNGGRRSLYIEVESGLGNNWIIKYVATIGSGHCVVHYGMVGFHVVNSEND